MTAARNLRVSRDRAALLVVDVQERLNAAMSDDLRASVERNLPVLIEAARRFGLPVVVSQQYPQGLGETIPAVAEPLAALPPEQVHRFDKVDFSVCATEPFQRIWERLGRDQWIVTGEEAHVCVYQSARELVDRGATVFVPRDAVASRTRSNHDTGLSLIERSGGVPTSTEVVVFDLLQRAGSDDFKALSRLIR